MDPGDSCSTMRERKEQRWMRKLRREGDDENITHRPYGLLILPINVAYMKD